MATYYSMYTQPAKQIRIDQYIAELVCFYNAKKEGQELPLQFWQLEGWNKFYFVQVYHAGKLLELYPDGFLVDFIRRNKIWSLGAAWIKTKMAAEFPQYRPSVVIETKEPEGPVTFAKKSSIDVGIFDE